jgi:hypothetical protein
MSDVHLFDRILGPCEMNFNERRGTSANGVRLSLY